MLQLSCMRFYQQYLCMLQNKDVQIGESYYQLVSRLELNIVNLPKVMNA